MRLCPKCGREYREGEIFCPRDGTKLDEGGSARGGPSHLEAPAAGARIASRYTIVDIIGRGGMGVVYKARHDILQREVAVKVLRRGLSRQLGSAKRFLREARACARLDHVNIVSIFDFGKDEQGRYYLVMEHVPGEPLHRVLRREGAFHQERAIGILRQVFSALEAAHSAGIVHRDLKPENMMCTERWGQRDFLKILDFGLAKILGDTAVSGSLTSPGMVMGTPEFMSPEQALGLPVDARSDLYAAGVLAYELVTGDVPFKGPPLDVVRGHREEAPRPPSAAGGGLALHPSLEALILALLAKDPADRFQTASAALAALDAIAAEAEVSRTPGQTVVEATRAELTRSSILSPSSQAGSSSRSWRSEGGPQVGAEPSTLRQPFVIDSVWKESALLDELGRLTALRGRRVEELIGLVWGAGDRPRELESLRASVASLEGQVAEREAEVALLRGRVQRRAEEARRQESELRGRRADLVMQAGEVRDELEATKGATSERATDRDEGDPRLGAELELVRESIEHIDRETAELRSTLAREVAAYERAIKIKLEVVGRLKDRLADAYQALETVVFGNAAEVEAAADHLSALREVIEAIGALRGMRDAPAFESPP